MVEFAISRIDGVSASLGFPFFYCFQKNSTPHVLMHHMNMPICSAEIERAPATITAFVPIEIVSIGRHALVET